MSDQQSTTTQKKNGRTALVLSMVVVAMFGFGFALVPLYDLFCEVTGTQSLSQRSVNGTSVGDARNIDETRWVTVKFDTTVNPELPWEFEAVEHRLRVHPGQTYEVNFLAKNRSNATVTGHAIPSVAPWQATPHFAKLECFCFSRQTLTGTQEVEMPLRFIVSRDLPQGIDSLTVSYNFMRVDMGDNEKPEQKLDGLPSISSITVGE